MNIEFIESRFEEIYKELEKEVMEILSDMSLDKRETNLRMKPLSSTKKILENAIDSIKTVQELALRELDESDNIGK
jgi:hypothetical protein